MQLEGEQSRDVIRKCERPREMFVWNLVYLRMSTTNVEYTEIDDIFMHGTQFEQF